MPVRFYVSLLLATALCTSIRAQIAEPLSVFRFEYEGKTVNVESLMRQTNTPALSVALDYGDGKDSTFQARVAGEEVLATTLFPAGAASSAPMLAAILQLVDRDELDLDQPVNNYLKRMQLPLNNGQEITVKDLMLFKVKFNVGYKPAGYAAGEPLPTLLELAQQLKPKGTRRPNANGNYGQWLPLQIMLEDAYGEDLQTVVTREVLRPLGITDMFYTTELSPAMAARAAKGHKENGDAWPGTYQRYVSTGNHGLWTTPLAYVRFTRAVLDILHGKEGSILRPATVKMALATTYGYRSLLFHQNNGQPYWGGNAKGYYFQMSSNLADNWVAVAAMNRQLNWRLGGPAVGQCGLLAKQWRSEDRLGIILQPSDLDNPSVATIEHHAFYTGVRTERIMAKDGLPAGITATPAYVYQSPAGRAIFSGLHQDDEAIKRFLRASRVAPKKTATDTRTNELTLTRGRQRIILPLKVTPPAGSDAPEDLPPAMATALRTALSQASGFELTPTVTLTAQDRRLYLDVHPYRTADGRYQFTYALFSQFDCHTPVYTSFGKPENITSEGKGLDRFASRIAIDLEKLLAPAAGFVPSPIPATTSVRSWADLGWSLDAAVANAQEVAEVATPVALAGTYRVSLTKADAPGLFFSFPAPLDRYAGEINELTASFTFTERGQNLSGRVDLPVAAISTGSGSLDTYVLGDILNSRKYSKASLVFQQVSIPSSWMSGTTQEFEIPATLNVRGKDYPVTVQAAFTPSTNGQLAISASFGLDFKKVFNNKGPDGPEDIRRQLNFQAKLLATPTKSAG